MAKKSAAAKTVQPTGDADQAVTTTVDATKFLGGAADAPVVEQKTNSKMTVATELYTSMRDKTRAEILKAFQETAGLTAKGAATYYQLVKRKLAAAAAQPVPVNEPVEPVGETAPV